MGISNSPGKVKGIAFLVSDDATNCSITTAGYGQELPFSSSGAGTPTLTVDVTVPSNSVLAGMNQTISGDPPSMTYSRVSSTLWRFTFVATGTSSGTIYFGATFVTP